VPTIAELFAELRDATAALVSDIDGLTDAEAREPSLLPSWSRGHVFTTQWDRPANPARA
jgi:maleylpyruvate isomerase